LAAVAAGNPLAIAPDEDGLQQRLMLESAGGDSGHCGACLGFARWAGTEQRP